MQQLYTASIVHRIGVTETKLFVAENSEIAFQQAYAYSVRRYGSHYMIWGEVQITVSLTHVPGYEIEVRKVHK